MDFTFNEDQLNFRDAIAAMLDGEVTTDRIRARWSTEYGRDDALLEQVQALGLSGMLVPESLDGLGLNLVDFVLIAEACGRVALPESVVESVMVVTPLLVDILDRGLGNGDVQRVLEALVSGEASVGLGHPINPCINFAASADWFLLGYGDELHLVPASGVSLREHKSVDPSRRLCSVDFVPTPATCIAEGDVGAELWRASLNRGSLSSAAQLLGLTQGIIDQTVQYTTDRQQFGKPIGANQAVKHLMADVAVQLEYAKPVVYRAAYTASVSPTRADFAVSHAKVAASRAAGLATRNGIQCHGAMGYTWECDLQIWVKRAWALSREWGDEGFHKNRIHEWLLRPKALLGPEYTFGRRSIADTLAQA